MIECFTPCCHSEIYRAAGDTTSFEERDRSYQFQTGKNKASEHHEGMPAVVQCEQEPLPGRALSRCQSTALASPTFRGQRSPHRKLHCLRNIRQGRSAPGDHMLVAVENLVERTLRMKPRHAVLGPAANGVRRMDRFEQTALCLGYTTSHASTKSCRASTGR